VPIATLAGAYDEAIDAFGAFLTERGKPPAQPELLNVVAVPRGVLCDPATSTERGKRSPSAAKCAEWVYYYRPTDRTLLVTGEPDVLGRALRLGIADYFALHHRELEADATAFAAAQK
jgi:hypothetical protein